MLSRWPLAGGSLLAERERPASGQRDKDPRRISFASPVQRGMKRCENVKADMNPLLLSLGLRLRF